MARWGGAASAWTALLALQLGAGCSSSEGGDSSTGDTDDGTTGSGGSTVGAGASAVASSSSGIGPSSSSGSGGSGIVECDPPAPPGSLYERTANAYDAVDPVSMCAYRDQVLLIVNTAAL